MITLSWLVLSFQASYNPGTNRGLVGTCLDIRATARYGSEHSWLEDDMIKALILDAIGAGIPNTFEMYFNMSLGMRFPTMWYFDKCRLRRVYVAFF